MEPLYQGDLITKATVLSKIETVLRGNSVCSVHRKSIKKLVLKNLNSSQYSSPVNKEVDELASPAEYPQNGHRCDARTQTHKHTNTTRIDFSDFQSRFYCMVDKCF